MENKNLASKTCFPTIDFVNSLDSEFRTKKSEQIKNIPEIEIDIPLGRADAFLKLVEKQAEKVRESKAWKELLKIAQDRAFNNPNSYWYLSEISNLGNFYARTAQNSGILEFIQDYIDKNTAEVDWRELARFASLISNEDEFREVCKKLGILDSSLRSAKIRNALADLVKEYQGIIVGEALRQASEIDLDEMKKNAFSHYKIIADRLIFKEKRIATKEILKQEDAEHRQNVYENLYSIPDSSGGWLKFYAEKYKEGSITDEELKNYVNTAIKDIITKKEAKKAIQETDIIRKIEDYNNNNYKILAEDLNYGQDVLVPEGTTGRVIATEQGMTTVLFEDYGIIATLPERMLKDKKEKEAFIAYGKKLDNTDLEIFFNGLCPNCLKKDGSIGIITPIPNWNMEQCLHCGIVYDQKRKNANLIDENNKQIIENLKQFNLKLIGVLETQDKLKENFLKNGFFKIQNLKNNLIKIGKEFYIPNNTIKFAILNKKGKQLSDWFDDLKSLNNWIKINIGFLKRNS